MNVAQWVSDSHHLVKSPSKEWVSCKCPLTLVFLPGEWSDPVSPWTCFPVTDLETDSGVLLTEPPCWASGATASQVLAPP